MRVLELFSGIGGMHYALKESGVHAEVVAAADINTTANSVYLHNFPSTRLLQRNIQSFTIKELNSLEFDMILMSPPCQPFTRVGLKKDISDDRTCSFLHILNLLPNVNNRFKYILVENVKGFENSEARNRLTATLESIDFIYQELILSPDQFHIPNSRHRYYLIGKRRPLKFIFTPGPLMEHFPIQNSRFDHLNERFRLLSNGRNCYSIENILEIEDDQQFKEFLVPDNVLEKRAWILDIVTKQCRRSCCFTKAYSHYTEGTGSIFCPADENEIARIYEHCKRSSNNDWHQLKTLKLRYFTPREVARLMCFPESFQFPPSSSNKQLYRVLSNSINVHVVAHLITLLILERDEPQI